jgi:hypothetical protein
MMGEDDCEVNIPLVELKESQVVSSKEIPYSEEISLGAQASTKVEDMDIFMAAQKGELERIIGIN